MRLTLLLLAALVACSSPSPEQQAQDRELASLAPLKARYSGVVMGFDFKPHDTLIVSLDIQSYIGMGDDDAAAMRAAIVKSWRSAWSAAHPGAHATIHVRLVDFIGRTIASEQVRV